MANPYELWNTHTSIGVMRDVKPENWYFGQFFTKSMRSEDEYIDFEKLPVRNRKLAPFVLPLGRGRGVFDDSSKAYRFKPAYVIVDESIDPLRPLTFAPGIDRSMLNPAKISPAQRLAILKAEMTAEAVKAIERRWEWLRAKAIIDGTVTLVGKDYPSVTVNFQRDAGQTEALTTTACWGQSGVSILDHVKSIMDEMNDAEFGAVPQRMTMGGTVAAVVRANTEILEHMDINVKGGVHVIDRAIAPSDKIYKLGELFIGGQSGQRIEMWVNNETYTADDGTATRYLGAKEVVFTGSPDSINGYECFGRIVDQAADWQALPIFPKNYQTGDDVKVEHMSFKSSPLMVPINPNATYKLTALD